MFFRKNNENQAEHGKSKEKYKAAPGTDIRFDPYLVGKLKSDHQSLLGIYMEIKSAFEARDYESVTGKLGLFRSELQEHLLTENVRLYIYLTHMFKNDDTNYELIRGFRKEMDGIAKTAMNFLKKYDAIGVDADLAATFGRDLATIGEVLGARIKKEENILYPLYMEHY